MGPESVPRLVDPSWLEALPMAVVRLDDRGCFSQFNQAAASLSLSLGLPPLQPDCAGLPWLEALQPDLGASLLRALSSPGMLLRQQALRHRDPRQHLRHLALTISIPEPGQALVLLEDRTVNQEAEAAWLSSERRYRDLMEHIPAGVVVHGASSEILQANAEASRLLGLSIEQLMGRVAVDPRWQFQHEDGRPMSLSEFPVNRVLATASTVKDLVIGVRRPDLAEPVWVICNAFPVFEQARLVQVVVSFVDVTGIKRTEQALQRSEERYRLVLRGATDAPWDWDLSSNQLYYSPRWWEMLGYAVDELPNDSQLWYRLVHADDQQRVGDQLRRWLDDGTESYEVEFRLLHKDGHYVPVLSRGFILRQADGQPLRISGTNADLSERKRAEARIHHLAYYDALTELPNRRYLIEQLNRAVVACGRSAQYGALLFIDLDHFKALNDSLGHDVGDALLRRVARRLRRSLRQADTVSRLGGDEFVVVLENLGSSPQQAARETEQVALKLQARLNRPYRLGARRYRGTPSLGMTLFDGDSSGADELLKQADLALYQAKAAGRNTLRFFDSAMQAELNVRVACEAELRDALVRDELRLHLQVQVDDAGQPRGAEGLLRWQHPQRGLVGPQEFIPLAEQTGLILPLGHWVLREGCRLLSRWQHLPQLADLTLALNVSAHQFRDPDFFGFVRDTLARSGAPAQRLVLELTESAAAEQIDTLIAKMNQLRALGVRFALDDFGTGYSSLNYLKRLPLHELKIDRSFVRDVLEDASDATLTRVIVGLAQAFGLQLIAEGVETEAQLGFLRELGCQRFQGYLFGRPEPADAFESRRFG